MQEQARTCFRFSGRRRLEKSINSLLGLLEGIAIDGLINSSELAILRMWLEDHQEVAHKHPFNELVPALANALQDGHLDDNERADLTWLCEKLRSSEFTDMVTADLQRLHALVGGIAADGVVTAEEMRGLTRWLGDHEHLKTCWPYDEVETLTVKVLADGRIDEAEHRLLMEFFTEFLAVLDERTIVRPMAHVGAGATLGALCAVDPEIRFSGASFCFSGASKKLERKDFEALVESRGGRTLSAVSGKLDFLVLGAEGNPCWAYACYGRKVEQAVELRKKGKRIVILHERDFHDAI